jgi:hypothetical protein
VAPYRAPAAAIAAASPSPVDVAVFGDELRRRDHPTGWSFSQADKRSRQPCTLPALYEEWQGEFLVVRWYHATMSRNFTVRLPDDVAKDAEALARAEGKSLNETVKSALIEAVERRRADPEFKKRLRRIIDDDRELLERLAK